MATVEKKPGGMGRQSVGLSIDQLLSITSIGGSEGPRWSPDGRQLTIVSSIGGSPDLWNINVESGMLTRLTSGMGGVGHLATFIPRWSPTGDAIAYVSTKNGTDEVWIWPTNGEAPYQLTRLNARIEAMSWSPDGESIAVASNCFGVFDIFSVRIADGETKRLTSDPRYEVYPVYTPDGQHILYVRLNDAWTDHDVVRIGVDGSDPEIILSDDDFFDYHYGRSFGYPSVSPDGSAFLFQLPA